MNKVIAKLFELQQLEQGSASSAPINKSEIDRLRSEIPLPILGHYDRLQSRGKKGVSVAKQDICSECHMRLASGIYNQLVRGDDIVLCSSCGRYLHYLPVAEATPVEPPPAPKPAKAPSKPRKKKATPEANPTAE
jgi:hypothetical protein